MHLHGGKREMSDRSTSNVLLSNSKFRELYILKEFREPKSRKFIDKKNAVTFNLVHRSQRDPLAADERAPQRVLVPIGLRPDENSDAKSTSSKDPRKTKEEEKKYGIFFDDDYDYLQHLKDVNLTAEWELAEKSSNSRVFQAPVVKDLSSGPKLALPSSVFASAVEEDVGLLNRAAPHSGPRLDLDPDIVAALDEDFDFDDSDNELEDDFITLANGGPPDGDMSDDNEGECESGDDCDESDGDFEDEEDGDTVGDLQSDAGRFSPNFDDDNKSRFTEYSMTSSVIRRNHQLSLLDDRFAQVMVSYDDDQMGALDCEEIVGYMDSSDSRLLKLAQEFEDEKTMGLRLGEELGKKARAEVEEAIEKYLDKCESDTESLEDDDEEGEPEKKWDCETILTTYSNIYNHPKLIVEPVKAKIHVCPKTGIPLNVLGKPGLTKKCLDQFNEIVDGQAAAKDDDATETRSMISTLSTMSIRPKDETPEQRKERKKVIKEFRRERRLEKKANTLAFKDEKKRQERQNLNNRVNIQGLKLL
nr:EOG090X08PQ [Sida crystallina]